MVKILKINKIKIYEQEKVDKKMKLLGFGILYFVVVFTLEY